jgi:general secretion pathway protein E/type IV pilus assembly protein PilB
MNIAESRLSQDGRISYNAIGRDVDFRVATQPTINGENIVLRTLDKKSSLVSLDNLGMHPRNLDLLKKSLLRPEGIIIVTGPTGSGKTTTLYSILNHINTIEKNIMTLEDPVEYNLPLIRQTNIRDTEGLTFTDGIKAIMRQDPDVIFVGEVRDAESASMAIRAAMTGHQVFTTLHTNDAIGTIARLLDIGINRTILSGVISCIIAQRLVRRLCDHCKKPKILEKHELDILRLTSRAHQDSPPTVYVHHGCDKCNNSGYKGRISINEVLYVDATIDEMIAIGATKNQINEYLKAANFLSMADDATYKILDGTTDLAEVISNVNFVSRM